MARPRSFRTSLMTSRPGSSSASRGRTTRRRGRRQEIHPSTNMCRAWNAPTSLRWEIAITAKCHSRCSSCPSRVPAKIMHLWAVRQARTVRPSYQLAARMPMACSSTTALFMRPQCSQILAMETLPCRASCSSDGFRTATTLHKQRTPRLTVHYHCPGSLALWPMTRMPQSRHGRLHQR